MSWGRIDDGLHDHSKVVALGPVTDPMGLWTLCFSWTHGHANATTPGFVPRMLPARFAGSSARGTRLARRLVDVGLWEVVDGGWIFHDWADYAAPARDRESTGVPSDLSEKRREAGRRGGEKAAEARRRAREAATPPVANQASAVANPVANEASADSTCRSPEPVPEPDSYQHLGAGSSKFGDGRASKTAAAKPGSAVSQQDSDRRPAALTQIGTELVDEYASAFKHSVPRKFRAGLLAEVDTLLAENFTREQVRAGLIALSKRRNVGPGLLPSLVHDALSGPAPAGSRPAGQRQMSAAERSAANLDAWRPGGALRTGQAPMWPVAVPDDPNIIDSVAVESGWPA